MQAKRERSRVWKHAAMVAPETKTVAAAPRPQEALDGLRQARERTLALIAHLSREELERQHSPIMSPLVWDLAHIAAYEDLWLVHRHTGQPLLREDLAALYDAFETPRAVRGQIELLDAPQSLDYMRQTRERTVAAIARHGAGDGFLQEMVNRHELQHTETMCQTMALAGLLPGDVPPRTPERQPRAHSGGGWIEIDAGPFEMGAPDGVFAFDNERPGHTVDLPAFRIAAEPVGNGQLRAFEADGGYRRRALWSQEGWEWLRAQEQPRHPRAGEGADRTPACHLSFYEAEALAAWLGARLPSEAEWERAAPLLEGRGHVWEWTGSELRGYPGFAAHPYREYSEVFFEGGYMVLRGGSWATHARLATDTFRNWDLPQRRQIFAGCRVVEQG